MGQAIAVGGVVCMWVVGGNTWTMTLGDPWLQTWPSETLKGWSSHPDNANSTNTIIIIIIINITVFIVILLDLLLLLRAQSSTARWLPLHPARARQSQEALWRKGAARAYGWWQVYLLLCQLFSQCRSESLQVRSCGLPSEPFEHFLNLEKKISSIKKILHIFVYTPKFCRADDGIIRYER